jgi:hypothetical protein
MRDLSRRGNLMGKNIRNRRLFITTVLALAALYSFPARSQAPVAALRGQVVDEDAQPVPRVEIVRADAAAGTEPIYTDVAGRFEIDFSIAGPVRLSFSKPGFFSIDLKQIDLMPGINDIVIPLNHETELQQNVEVHSASTQIDPETTSHQETVVQRQMIDIPVPTDRDVQQSLITMPQVLADSAGRLHVAGARQGQTEVLLDGFEINDPGTGAFNARLNVDAVQDVSVQTGGYGAEYAHAGAGVLAIDTVTGDDRLRLGVTNFVPGLNLQKGVHFGNWYPRVTFSGPFKKGKVWFSEAVTGQRTFHLVTELPAGQNTDIQWGGDNLFRVQVSLASWNTLQGSFLFNRADDDRAGLGPYSPVSTTTQSASGRYFFAVKDQLFLGHTVFDLGAAYDTGSQSNTPQGILTYTVTPSNTSGNYFQRTAQKSRRLQGIGNVTASSLHWHGEHTLSAGWNVSGVDFSQMSTRNQIDFVRADGTLSDQTSFLGPGAAHLADTQLGGYAQDHWRPFKPLMLSAGLRADWDRLIHRSIVEPRLAMNWVPARDGSMKFTLGWGIHYQPLNLQILSQGFDQQRSDLFYDSTGVVPMLPPTITTFVVPLGQLLQPRSYNTTVQWDYKAAAGTYVGAAFLLREGRNGFAYQTASPPGTFLLQNNRRDRYVSGEVWAQHSFGDKAEISVDYTRSSATSSQVFDPTLAQLIFSSQGPGPVLWDSPNRVVATGTTPLPVWQLFLSGFFEYHSGFPFSSINEQQQLVGAPNSKRFPAYLSLDLGVEKRFKFYRHEWAIRISGINLTGHNNPDSVVNNVDAPNYLSFAGGHTLALTGRLRLVTATQP